MAFTTWQATSGSGAAAGSISVFYEKNEASGEGVQGRERAFNPAMPYRQEKVIRGGSFLCGDDYCSGYRNARRMGSTVDTGLNHTGFRCVKEVE
jgi:formylglycine-generating enzyme